MKQADLKEGKTVYIKESFKPSSLSRGQAFTIKRITHQKNGVNLYFNEMGDMVKANELTEIPCGRKICPCH